MVKYEEILSLSTENGKGENHIPVNVHQALQWSKKSPFLLSPCENKKWEIVEGNQKESQNLLPLPVGHKNLNAYVPIQSKKPVSQKETSIVVKSNKVNKVQIRDTYSMLVDVSSTQTPGFGVSVCNIITNHHPQTPPLVSSQPKGTIWDAQNWSCSYDALFTILWNMWREDHQAIATQDAIMQNLNFHTLIEGFVHHEAGNATLDQARNTVRNRLNAQNAQKFPWGSNRC